MFFDLVPTILLLLIAKIGKSGTKEIIVVVIVPSWVVLFIVYPLVCLKL